MDTLKNREDQLDDDQPQPDDNQPAFDIKRDGDEATVQPSGMTKAEERRKKWNERVGNVISEHTKPLSEQVTTLNQRVESLLQSLSQQRQQPQLPPPEKAGVGVDPDFMKIRRRQSEIMSLVGQARTQAEIDRLEEEYYRLDQDALDIRSKKLAEVTIENFRRSNPTPMSAEQQMVTSEFPDVIGHQQAASYAALLFRQAELEAHGKPFNRMEAHRKALKASGEKYGLRRPEMSPADPNIQARFGGAPPSSGRGKTTPGGVKLTKQQRDLAIASAPPGTSVEEAERSWVQHALKKDPNFFG